MKYKVMLVLLVVGLVSFGGFSELMAQFPPPPPPQPQSGPSGAPIDGGAIGLLVAGAAYGARELRRRRRAKQQAE